MTAPVLRATRTKRADETVTLTFEFAAVLVPTTVLSGSPTFVVQTGLTQVGAGSVSGTQVSVQVSGGTTGEDYRVTCRMNASNADVHQLEVVVLIRDEN